MRNMKAVGLFALAIVAGLGAAIYAAGWVSQRAGVASSKIVVAAVDIELGSKIGPQMLTTVEWPAGSVPDGAFKETKQVEDRVLKVALMRGDAVLDRKLAPAGTQGGLSAVIADGKRAMTVRVNDVVGVAGFALPGNFVDVMLNAQHDRGTGQTPNQVSMTVLEQVLVLAVAQEASRDDTKPKVVNAVTLELSPQDSEKLDLARSVGTLSLVLRNQLDKRPVAAGGISRVQLLHGRDMNDTRVVGAAAEVPVRATPAPTRARMKAAVAPCVEVIRHGIRSSECF